LFSLASELCYNICPTAESRLGTTHTAETKAAIGAASAARNSGENHPMCGKTHTAETKALMSKAHIGKTHTAEAKALISEASSKALIGNTNRLGKTHTTESINLIRLNHPTRISIFVYEHETRKLVGEYSSQRQAAKSFNIALSTLQRYLANGQVWNNKYIIRTSPLL